MSILSELKDIAARWPHHDTLKRAIEWLEKNRAKCFSTYLTPMRYYCNFCGRCDDKLEDIRHVDYCAVVPMYGGYTDSAPRSAQIQESEIRNHSQAIEFLSKTNESLRVQLAKQEKLIGVMRAQMALAEATLKGGSK